MVLTNSILLFEYVYYTLEILEGFHDNLTKFGLWKALPSTKYGIDLLVCGV